MRFGSLFVQIVYVSGSNPGSEPSSVQFFSPRNSCFFGLNPGSEPRIPGHFPLRRHSQAVRQRSAKPSSPVRFRVAPPTQTPPFAGVFFGVGGATLHRTRLRPRSARSGIRSASPPQPSGSLLTRGKAWDIRRRRNSGSPQSGVLSFWIHHPTCRRRIPFACRSPAHSFKRVLWATPLHKNAPPGRFCSLTSDRVRSASPPQPSGSLLTSGKARDIRRRRNSGTQNATDGTPHQSLRDSFPSEGKPKSSTFSTLPSAFPSCPVAVESRLGDTAFPKLSAVEFWGR